MAPTNHKAIRRQLLNQLYAAYIADPLRMVEPEVFLDLPGIDRTNIIPNMHYLHDRKLVEMMLGYSPPMFSAVRITPAGIDLVEDRYTFDLQFPPQAVAGTTSESALPGLIEHLIAQGDLSPLDGHVRQQVLNDIQFLRHELAQDKAHWRPEVIRSVLDWLEERHLESGGALPACELIRKTVHNVGQEQSNLTQPNS